MQRVLKRVLHACMVPDTNPRPNSRNPTELLLGVSCVYRGGCVPSCLWMCGCLGHLKRNLNAVSSGHVILPTFAATMITLKIRGIQIGKNIKGTTEGWFVICCVCITCLASGNNRTDAEGWNCILLVWQFDWVRLPGWNRAATVRARSRSTSRYNKILPKNVLTGIPNQGKKRKRIDSVQTRHASIFKTDGH